MENKLNADALQSEMVAKAAELESQRKMHESQMVTLTLERILGGIASQEKVILPMITASKGKCQKEVMQMVVKEVQRSSDDSLWCSDFSLRPGADQQVYCYTGNYWKLVEPAQWKDFVARCAKSCGLPENMLMDTSFMKKMFESMAYNVFKYREQVFRGNEVWLNLPNCTLELKADGSVTDREHRKDDLFYYCLPYPYEPKADCPLWHHFLDHVLPDQKAQQVLAEFIGYSLMQHHQFEKMLWLVGPGQNGKSTVLDVLESLFGSENVSNLSLDQLTNDQIMRSAFEHKLLNISSETGDKINASVMKRICSGEAVTVEQKYVNPHETRSYGKVIMATNELPKPENTSAFFRRIIMLSFEVTITDDEKDVHLADKLKTELPGILNWVLESLPPLMERNEFTTSESSERIKKEYELESDNVKLFLYEMLEPSATSTHGQDLFDAYLGYCKNSNLYPTGRTKFYKRLDSLTHAAEKKQNVTYFKLKLVEP